MTNPFSRFLRQWSKNEPLEQFVNHWDQLEQIMVQVYRRKATPEQMQQQFDVVWLWLQERYARWEVDLRPFWRATKAGGEPTTRDPFAMLLAFETPHDILGDWTAMQHLPAAREALNRFVMSQEK